MTAIAVSPSQQGFIIGADGRGRVDDASRAANPTPAVRDNQTAQKIFPILGQDRCIAYAVAGNVIATDPEPPFNGIEECSKLARIATDYNYENATKLVNQFSKALTKAINEAKHFPQLDARADGSWTIMDLIFARYFRGVPFLIYVNFHHSNRFAEFRSQQMQLDGVLYGSDIIRRAMYDDSGRVIPNSLFSEYVQDPQAIQSLEDSEKYVKGYIQACSTDLALSMDEPICKRIGGRIHVAQITPTGFRWRIPPLTE